MKQILVGVDGSDAAAAALGWAVRLASVTGAEVVAAEAFHADEAEQSPERYAEVRREAMDRLAAERALQDPTGSTLARSLLLPDSTDALIEAADREDSDLVVVGPRGPGRHASLHLGSLAHHLAHYSTRPLAIVPESGSSRGFDRIIVGIDGSTSSLAAARWALDLARRVNGQVVVAYAFKPPIEWFPESDTHSWTKTAERQLESWVTTIGDDTSTVETRLVKNSHPVEGLAAVISELDADLVVVGARGTGGFAGLRVGRVPLQLVHHTRIPVLMVPAPES